jgi:HlyD family secretion protein
MTASTTFTYAEKPDVLRIPNAALRFRPDPVTLPQLAKRAPAAARGDERTLWLLRSGEAVAVSVHVGISDGNTTELTAGAVSPGDRAIIEAGVDAAKRSP